MTNKSLFTKALALSLALILTSCGGGGGGGNSSSGSAAFVTIDANPKSIDTGDRFSLTIKLKQVNDDGIILKIKYPSELSYVLGSAFLEVDGSESDISPSFNVTDSSDDTYLVFFLSQSEFDDNGDGAVKLELKGLDSIKSGKIEVDPDIDDPLVSNPGEFDIENPSFNAEDSVEVTVAG